MKSRLNAVAAVALLALLNAGPAAADWQQPGGDCGPAGLGFDSVLWMAEFGLQILQVAL